MGCRIDKGLCKKPSLESIDPPIILGTSCETVTDQVYMAYYLAKLLGIIWLDEHRAIHVHEDRQVCLEMEFSWIECTVHTNSYISYIIYI